MPFTLNRRGFLTAAGSALAGLVTASLDRTPDVFAAPVGSPPAIIRMRSEGDGMRVTFDPVGLHVSPGTTLRWVLESGAHSATAYHPDHDRPLRIPAGAEPWDSGVLFEPLASFDVALDLPGVYDVFCIPHEAAGMVGRIVAGTPGVDFEVPAWARPGAPRGDDRLPARVRDVFPSVRRIVERGRVPGFEPPSRRSRGDTR